MMDPKTFAASTLQLLQQDPRRYRNFGRFWWFVKALLKHYYTRDNLHLLGGYMAPDAEERMGQFIDLETALDAAAEEYRQNASFNLGRNQVEAPDGEVFTLVDPDAGL